MRKFLLVVTTICFLGRATAEQGPISDDNPLKLLPVGSYGLRILSPTVLELTLITTKKPDPALVSEWNWVDGHNQFHPPSVVEFEVVVAGQRVPIKKMGFKRRPIYAPLRVRDLRIGNYLYLQLANPIADGVTVEVKNSDGKLWAADRQFVAKSAPLRWNPAIHVNQEGYLPGQNKKAMVGYYLGSLGELDIDHTSDFSVVDAAGKTVFEGSLLPRKDVGYEYEPLPYQKVMEADFSGLKTPGQYRLQVPGMGVSFPFVIDEGIGALFARTYALGLYHQRCGAANEMPFTRFVHGPCHTAPAEIPTSSFKIVNEVIEQMTGDWKNDARRTAPRLKNISASLYPFVNKGKIDVSGGHHDAGDYSKYTINVAQLIHTLVLAADAFPGVAALDNLGLPESGDGKSDILEEAKWEADFLARMQDADGGFYFLVYPREREYEHDVLPDKSDPQVVFPKTTAATAAAVAALAQTASSPVFKQQFPAEARLYLEKAQKGWDFLQRSFAKFGRDGAYQKITHYGDEFMHDDEVAWAATELFLATGDEKFHKELLEHFDPTSRDTKRWSWVRMFESYGCAIRSYALAAKTKRLRREQLDEKFLRNCEEEVIAAAQDQVRFAEQTAYATSFPDPSKKFRNAGWYFSSDHAFDIAVACALDFPERNDPRARFYDAIIGNLNFEAGCNPANVSFISGLGWKRQHEMVNQYAQNDRRDLPPSGLVFGNIQEGLPYLDPYKKEPGQLTFPSDGDQNNPYPFYDRWSDTFNTSAEFVSVNVARALATAALLMAQTPLKDQAWKAARAELVQTASGDTIQWTAKVPGVDLDRARFVWETSAPTTTILAGRTPLNIGSDKRGLQWIELEAYLPDGRRFFAVTNLAGRK